MSRRKRELSFEVSAEERDLIREIARRASDLAAANGVDYTLIDAQMDLTAVHANGNPLRLADLLAAEDHHFGHDVFGIRRFLDRSNGELRQCFRPRYSTRGAR